MRFPIVVGGTAAPRDESGANEATGAPSEAGPTSSAGAPGAAHLAHAINNPLAIVVANLEMLAELFNADAQQLSMRIDEARDLLSEARDAVERLRNLAAHIEPLRPAETTAAALEPTPGRRLRVLIVDDEPALGRALARTLREHDIETFDDARDAMARLVDGERYDVIVSDLMMPEMTGMDFYDAVARLSPDHADRMIFVTGGATTTRARDFVTSMDDDRVMEKPWSVRRLRELIRRRGAPI